MINPKELISAYKLGIFPMAESRKNKKLFFVEPEFRAIIPIQEFKFSKSFIRLVKKRPFEIIKIGLNTDRKKLYSRINKRVDFMMEYGLLEEALALIDFQNLNSLKTVGYKEIFSFINNECSLKEAVDSIKQNTRRFAKRQITWFKKDKEVNWFEPHEYDKIKSFIEL